MSNAWARKQKGFTIVELLIVVVVIGILAALTLVAYSNIQKNARDADRKQDIASIKKMLLLYQVDNGGMQSTSTYGGAGPGGWDSSDRAAWLGFLGTKYGKVPTDPKNIPPVSPADAGSGTGLVYFYYCYPAGSGPAPATPNVVLGYRSEKLDAVVRDIFAVDSCI